MATTKGKTVYLEEGEAVVWPSRPLTQEELDGHWRNEWIQDVIKLLEGRREIKFLAHKNHHSLVTLHDKFGTGAEWEFSIGDQRFYCYRLSLVYDFLEKIWDSGAEVISLKGEVNIPKIIRVKSEASES